MHKALTIALLLSCGWVSPLQAHDSHGGEVSPTLSAVPKALTGIHVQLSETLAPQLLIDNPTGKLLIVFGQDGQPLLRFGKQGAEANTRHPEWLKSYLPGGLPARKPELGSTPLWKLIRSDPSWGWFDLRLKPDLREVGDHWRIPVSFDGKASEISGRFSAAIQSGYWQASWAPKPILPAGISLMLIPGQPYGMMLSNLSAETVTVLGRQGEPFIRISPKGTEASMTSPLWQETATQQALRYTADTTRSPWVQLNTSQRHTWVEPRTRGLRGQKQPLHWQIGLQVGEQTLQIKGISRWVSKR